MAQEFLIDLPVGAMLDKWGNPVPLVQGEQWISSYSWVLGLSKVSSADVKFSAALDAAIRADRGFLSRLRAGANRLALLNAAFGSPTLEAEVRSARMYRKRQSFAGIERGRGGIRVNSKRRLLARAVAGAAANGGIMLPFPGKSLTALLRSIVGDFEAARSKADLVGAASARLDERTREVMRPVTAEVQDDVLYDVPLAALFACVPGVYELPPVEEVDFRECYDEDFLPVGDDVGSGEFLHVMRRAVIGQHAALARLQGFVASSPTVPTTETLAQWAASQGLLRVNNDVMLAFRRWLMGFLPAMLGNAVLHRAPGPQTGRRPIHLAVPDSDAHPDAPRYLRAWGAIEDACAKFHENLLSLDWYPRISCPITTELHARSVAARLDALYAPPQPAPRRSSPQPVVGSIEQEEVKVPYALRQVPHRVWLRRQRKPGLFNTMTPEEQYAWRVAQAAKARAVREENRREREAQKALLLGSRNP